MTKKSRPIFPFLQNLAGFFFCKFRQLCVSMKYLKNMIEIAYISGNLEEIMVLYKEQRKILGNCETSSGYEPE